MALKLRQAVKDCQLGLVRRVLGVRDAAKNGKKSVLMRVKSGEATRFVAPRRPRRSRRCGGSSGS